MKSRSFPILGVVLAMLCLPGPTRAACRQALALGLDVSSSVDPVEYELQMGGLAKALLDDEVQALILAQPSAPVALAIYEWSSAHDQTLIVDWKLITDAGDLRAIAAALDARRHRAITRSTALGHAIRFGGALLDRAPGCWHLTLDISGDGKNNDGFLPDIAHRDPVFRSATINGLVIDFDSAENDQITDYRPGDLSKYYRDEVIQGANAFIQTANGFRDYSVAMRRKLLRELDIAVSGLRPGTGQLQARALETVPSVQ